MAKALLWISVIIMAITATLGLMTKGKVDAINKSLVDTRKREATLKTEKASLQADLKKTTEELTAANKEIEEKKGQLAAKETELGNAKAETARVMEEKEEVNKKLIAKTEEYQKLADSVPKDPAGMSGDIGTKIADMTKQIEDGKRALAEQQAVADALKAREKDTESKMADMSKELDRYRKQIARPGITGRVVAVNQGWNFVVVDVGDRRGAVMNAPLIVTRNGQQVARLKITAVEPSTSIADVVPGSMPRGQTVQPGDSVIFAGRQPAPTPEGGAGAPGAAQAQVN